MKFIRLDQKTRNFSAEPRHSYAFWSRLINLKSKDINTVFSINHRISTFTGYNDACSVSVKLFPRTRYQLGISPFVYRIVRYFTDFIDGANTLVYTQYIDKSFLSARI